jgi:hypothetical protein
VKKVDRDIKIDTTKFEWTDNDIQKFNGQVEYFKSFRNKSINQDNFYEAYKTCYLLFDKIPIPSTRVDVNYILRGRPNLTENHFKEEWEISYNSRNKHLIPLGRFNRPLDPMFYSSVPDEIGDSHFGLVAAMECHKELFIEDNTVLTQYFTFGKWYLNTHFDVVNLCNDEKFLASNPRLGISTKKHEDLISRTFSSKAAGFIIQFWKFLSELSGSKCENEHEHFLTTAFLCAIINYRKNEMNLETHGALYPSTITENKGLNIVLHPDAVDKFLNLKSAFMVKFSRNPVNFKTFGVEQCTHEAKVINSAYSFLKKSNY